MYLHPIGCRDYFSTCVSLQFVEFSKQTNRSDILRNILVLILIDRFLITSRLLFVRMANAKYVVYLFEWNYIYSKFDD